MLKPETRRQHRHAGEDTTDQVLRVVRQQGGNEALESYADGVIASVGRALAEAISPAYAIRALEDGARRIAQRTNLESQP